jgi:hypothetical protein
MKVEKLVSAVEGFVTKVEKLVFALLVSAPVLMGSSAYADCGSSNCKSQDTAPVDGTATPAVSAAAPVVRADNCSGSNCKDDSDDAAITPDRRHADGCSSSGCKSEDTPPVDGTDVPAPLLTAPPERIAPQVDQSNARAFILYLPVPPPR